MKWKDHKYATLDEETLNGMSSLKAKDLEAAKTAKSNRYNTKVAETLTKIKNTKVGSLLSKIKN